MAEVWIAAAAVAVGTTAYTAYNQKKLFGDKPDVPVAPTVGGILSDTIAANKAALPGATQLASGVNAANQDELMKNFRNVAGPGVYDDIKKITANLSKQAQGEFPDLARSTFDMGAVSAIKGGYAGSGMDANRRFRDYGLKQYEETNKAIGSYQQWLSGAKSLFIAPQTSAASFLATPGMGQDVANKQLDINLYGSKVAAAPTPGAAEIFNQSMGMISNVGALYVAAQKKKEQDKNRDPWLGSGSGEGDAYSYMPTSDWTSGLV